MTGPGAAADGSVQVLDKAGRVLDCFSASTPGLRMADLRSRTGLPATTCQRIVRTLVQQNLLQRDDDVYRIGLRVLMWSAAATSGSVLLAAAAPVLRPLRDTTGETVGLFVRHGNVRVIVASVESQRSIIYRAHVGAALPLAAGAAGKVFLAWDPEALATARRDGLERHTADTITDWTGIDEQLETARLQGWTLAEQEREVGLSSLAAAVFDREGAMVAALSIGAPSFRLTPDVASRCGPQVRAGADEVSRALGWIGHDDQTSARPSLTTTTRASKHRTPPPRKDRP